MRYSSFMQFTDGRERWVEFFKKKKLFIQKKSIRVEPPLPVTSVQRLAPVNGQLRLVLAVL